MYAATRKRTFTFGVSLQRDQSSSLRQDQNDTCASLAQHGEDVGCDDGGGRQYSLCHCDRTRQDLVSHRDNAREDDLISPSNNTRRRSTSSR